MTNYVPDNYDAYEAYEREITRQERHLPICCMCEEHIWQEDAVYIDGKWYCDQCLDDNRVYIDEEDEW